MAHPVRDFEKSSWKTLVTYAQLDELGAVVEAIHRHQGTMIAWNRATNRQTKWIIGLTIVIALLTAIMAILMTLTAWPVLSGWLNDLWNGSGH
jgi:hypothetical protein